MADAISKPSQLLEEISDTRGTANPAYITAQAPILSSLSAAEVIAKAKAANGEVPDLHDGHNSASSDISIEDDAKGLMYRMQRSGQKIVVVQDDVGNRLRCQYESANDTRSRGSGIGRVDDTVRISVQDELLALKRAGMLPMFSRNRPNEYIDGHVRQLSCIEWLHRYYEPWLRNGRLTQNILRVVDKNLRASIFSYAEVRGEPASNYVPASK